MSTELSPKAAEIANYAQALLEAGGYNSFSYANIATQVNISKASIHHHFPSKAELVRVVVSRYRQQALQGLELMERHQPDALSALKAYADYWSGCILGQTSSFCVCAMLAAELPSIPDIVAVEVQGHFRDLSVWLTRILEAGQQAGQFNLTRAAETEAKSFMADIHGAMVAARGFGDPQVFPELVGLAIDRLTSVTN